MNTRSRRLDRLVPRIVIAAAVAVALLLPLGFDTNYYLRRFTIIAVTVLLAQSLNLLGGYSGQVSLGHAGFYAIGAYAAAMATTAWDLGFWPGVALSIAAAAAAGLLLGLPALRVSGHYLAVVTIGFGIIVYHLLMEGGALTGGFAGIQGVPKPMPFGEPISLRATYYVALGLAGLATWMLHNLSRSRAGRAFFAVRDVEVAAESLGISVYRAKLQAFVVSAALAGLAGNLFAHVYNYVSPDSFTVANSILLLVMVIMGGIGRPSGPVLGVVLLEFLLSYLQVLQDYRLVVYGLLMLGFTIFKPGGLVELFPEGWRRGLRDEVAALQAGDAAARGDASAARGPAGDRELPAAVVRPEVRELARGGGRAGREPLLRLTGFTKRFGGLHALDRVDMEVRPGTIHALIGPNGSGKTTLLHTLSGIYRPDGGRVEFAGRDITGMPASALAGIGIARTFQHSQVFPRMTALENVLVGQHHWRRADFWSCALSLPWAVAEERDARRVALELLDVVGISERAHHPAGGLPTGTRRLLEVARALAARPRLILLDEPAAGLTGHEVEALDELLIRLRRQGYTILLIEHDMRLVMRISDAVTVLDSGRVIAAGTPMEVQANPRVIQAYLGDAAD